MLPGHGLDTEGGGVAGPVPDAGGAGPQLHVSGLLPEYLAALFLLPSIRKKHETAIAEIRALEIHYTKAEESRIFAMLEKYPDQMTGLSEREREVAALAAEGLRNKEIAQRLFISEETVKSHIRSIFNKTNIDRRSKLVDLLK